MMSATHAATTGLPREGQSPPAVWAQGCHKHCSIVSSLPRTPRPPCPPDPAWLTHGLRADENDHAPSFLIARSSSARFVRRGRGTERPQVSSAVHPRFDIRASSAAGLEGQITGHGGSPHHQRRRHRHQGADHAQPRIKPRRGGGRLHEMVRRPPRSNRLRRPTKPTFGSNSGA